MMKTQNFLGLKEHRRAMYYSQKAKVQELTGDLFLADKFYDDAIKWEYKAIEKISRDQYNEITAQIILKSLLHLFERKKEWKNVIFWGYYIKDFITVEPLYSEILESIKSAEEILSSKYRNYLDYLFSID